MTGDLTVEAVAANLVPLIQLGSFGVLVALIWHIVKVQIPAQDQRSDERQGAFLAAINKVHDDCAKEREMMLAAFENQVTSQQENFRAELAIQREHDTQETQRLARAFERRERNSRGDPDGGA
jgi:hypothetical protein